MAGRGNSGHEKPQNTDGLEYHNESLIQSKFMYANIPERFITCELPGAPLYIRAIDP